VNGGYQVKLHYIKAPSTSKYYPVVVDVTNNSGQNNIFIHMVAMNIKQGMSTTGNIKITSCFS